MIFTCLIIALNLCVFLNMKVKQINMYEKWQLKKSAAVSITICDFLRSNHDLRKSEDNNF